MRLAIGAALALVLIACSIAPPTATPNPAAALNKPFRLVTKAEWLAVPQAARLAFLASLLTDYTGCDLGAAELDGIMHFAYLERQPPVDDPPLHVFALTVTGAGCRPTPDAVKRLTPAP